MATREAGIKVTLNQSSFLAGLDQIGQRAKTVGGQIKSGLQAGFKGVGGDMFKSGKDSIKDLAGGLKQTIGQVATLGGGIGFGMLVKRAADLRGHMRDIEFAVNKTGKQTADWRDLMASVQDATDETGKSSEDLGDILGEMFEGGGDIEFATAALKTVGHASQASGKDLKQLAGIAVMLQEKFGATAETLPEMLAAVIQKTDQGGLSLAAMGDKFGLLAGEAADAGFAGAEGMASVLGMLNSLDDRLGEKSIPSFKKLFQTLKDGSASLKAISKESGIKFTEGMSGADKLRAIVSSDKGRKAMSEKLGGEQRVVFDLLAKPFEDAMASAKGSGAKTKEATNAGLAAWDAAMKNMGDASLRFQDILEHSKAKQEDDPQIKLNKAIDKIAAKFTEPQMLDALDQLSESLPKVATAAIKLIDFATKHPALAAAGFVGAKVGGSMAMAGIGKMFENVGGAVGGAITGALKSGGASLAADIKGTMAGGAPAWGKAMGAALGIAGAAAIAFEIGKALIDARIEEKEAGQKAAIGTSIEGTNAANRGDLQAAQAAKDKLVEQNLRLSQEMKDSLSDAVFDGMAGMIDSEHKPQAQQQYEQTNKDIAALSEAIAKLTEKTNAASKSTEGMAEATKKAGQAAGGAASAFFNVGGGTPTETTGGGVSKGPGGAPPARPGFFD